MEDGKSLSLAAVKAKKVMKTRMVRGDDRLRHQDRQDQRDLRMMVHALPALRAGLDTVFTDSLAVPFAAAPCSSWPLPM
jgi:hypothetical protein